MGRPGLWLWHPLCNESQENRDDNQDGQDGQDENYFYRFHTQPNGLIIKEAIWVPASRRVDV